MIAYGDLDADLLAESGLEGAMVYLDAYEKDRLK